MPDTTGGNEKTRRRTIDKQSNVFHGQTTQNPVNPHQGHTNLKEDKSKVGPIHSIKCFSEIQLEDKGTPIFWF